MPLTATNTPEPEGYGDRPYDELISSVLGKIVYASITHFDEVFAEFDRIIAGERSTTLNDLYELFTNKFQTVPTQPAAVAKLQQDIKTHLCIEKGELRTEEQRSARLQEQENKQKLQENVNNISRRAFPTTEDRKVMDECDLDPTTLRPEFAMCIAIHIARKNLDAFLTQQEKYPASNTDRMQDAIENQLHAVYGALDMQHEANLITRNMRAELNKLLYLQSLLNASTITVKQMRKFSPETKTALIKSGADIIKEIAIDVTSETNLMAYIECRELLLGLNPYIDFNSLWFELRRSEANNEPVKICQNLRQKAIDLFATKCDFSVPYSIADNELYCYLITLFGNLKYIAIPNDMTLMQIYSYDAETIRLAWASAHDLSKKTQETRICPHLILRLSPSTRNALLYSKKLSEISKLCKQAGISLDAFLAMSIVNVEFLLADTDRLPKMTMLLRNKIVAKTDFLAANLQELNSWINQRITLKGLFKLMAQPDKDYAAISDNFAGLEFTTNQQGISAYSYAMQQRDPQLIDIIAEGITLRSAEYLNAFLMSHGFMRLRDTNAMLHWYNVKNPLVSDRAINSVDINGNTPLLVAIAEDDYVAALTLIVLGADIFKIGKDGLSPLELASSLRQQNIATDLHSTIQHLNGHQVQAAISIRCV